MSDLLFPTGFTAGALFTPENDASSGLGIVRLGDEYCELDHRQFRVWTLSFEFSTRDSLVEAAKKKQLNDPRDILESILDIGLLTQINKDNSRLPKILSNLKLVSLGFGLGNSEDDLGGFVIAGNDLTPRLRTNFDIYSIWTVSYRASIWETCQQIADNSGGDPITIARNLVDNLPMLLGSGSAYLDTAK